MSKGQELFDLIKSLSNSQKRYFKVSRVSSNNTQNNYILLFDALDRQKQFDQERLTQRLKEHSFIKRLPAELGYLYESLLKSMRSYESSKTPEIQIPDLKKDIIFLFDSGLYKQALKRIAKAKKITRQYERLLDQLDLIEWELRCTTLNSLSATARERIKLLQQEKQAVITKVVLETKAQRVHENFLGLHRSYNMHKKKSSLDKLDELLKEVNHIAQQKDITIKTTFYTNQCHVLSHMINGNILSAYSFQRQIINKFESQTKLKESLFRFYRSALTHYAALCIRLAKFDEAKQAYSKAKEFKPRNKMEEVRYFQQIDFAEFFFYLNIADRANGIKKAKQIIRKLEDHKVMLNRARLCAYYYNLTAFYFDLQDYTECEKWIENIIELEVDSRKDIQEMIRIFRVIMHLEISDRELALYYYNNAYRYLYARSSVGKYEKQIMGYLKHIVEGAHPDKIEKAQEKLLIFLNNILSTEKGTGPLGVSEIYCWLQSKKTGKTVWEIYEQRAKERLATSK